MSEPGRRRCYNPSKKAGMLALKMFNSRISALIVALSAKFPVFLVKGRLLARQIVDRLTPARLLVLSFFVLILAGVFLLSLDPVWRHRAGSPGFLVDSLFTVTSAVCVTGLTVADTGSGFSRWGQVLILVLIQLGGLGILTCTNFIVLLRRMKAGFSERRLIEESHGLLPGISPVTLVRSIFLFTMAIEACGAVLLALRFYFGYGMRAANAIWYGVFHSISAFCNAGFALFSDSLVVFGQDWMVNAIIMFLIISGGLGFVVVADLTLWLASRKRGKRRRLTLHSKMVLVVSIALLSVGFLLFFILELTGPAMPESVSAHVLESLFLSITARTAGFNTVEMSHLTNASLLGMMFLMFIGGSPGSTAGGVKTTTLGVLVALIASKVRNRQDAEAFSRRIPNETVAKALLSIIGFLLSLFVAVILIQVTELYGVPHSEYRGVFMEYLFEVVSALCTVGLSTGITASLSIGGKLILIICMFIGRVGPVLLAGSLIGHRKRLEYRYPEEDMIVG